MIALALAIPTLLDSPRRSGLTLDTRGVWLVGLALVAIIYPLIQGRADGWPLWSFGLLAAGLLLLLAFLRHERSHQDNALIEPTLLQNRTYLSGIAVPRWACLVPLAGAFLFVFRLPMDARDEQESLGHDDETPSLMSSQSS